MNNFILKLIAPFITPYTLYWSAAGSLALSAISGNQKAQAAKGSANARQQVALDAKDEQRRQFDITQQQSQPFRDAELAALNQREPLRQEATNQQAALAGLMGKQAQQDAINGINQSAGQEFIRGRQEQSLLRNSASIGGLGGGNIRTELQKQAAGFAQQDLQNQLKRLSAFTGSQGGGSTNLLADQRGNLATNVGNLGIRAGNAQAGGIFDAELANRGTFNQVGAGLLGGALGMQGKEPIGFQKGFVSGLARF